MPKISRRAFLSSTAMLCASPLFATTSQWQSVVNKARGFEQCRAIVIFQDGKQVLAEVFRGPSIDRPVPIKSVSKTVVAALAGAAIDRGEIPIVTSTLGELIPDLIPPKAHPEVKNITVENLLTMQAGLERTSGRNYGAWVNSRDWVSDALSRPMAAEPGTRMLYSTGSSHIMGTVLSEVSNKSLLSLARDRLGEPLGIKIPAWTRDPQGRYLGGNEMAMSLEAMVRFGELYRNRGRVGDNQVLSKAWVDRSLVSVTRSVFSGLGYGYGWFLGESGGNQYALARGYGGQVICIVPQLKLTIAITSDPTRLARSAGYFGDLLNLIDDDIISAARL